MSLSSTFSWLGTIASDGLKSKSIYDNAYQAASVIKKAVDTDEDDDVVEAALFVACRMLENETEVSKVMDAFDRAGVLIPISRSLESHISNVSITILCLRLCAQMCSNDNNRNKLFTSGISLSVLTALVQHLKNADVAEWGCKLLRNLLFHPASFFQISSMGVCEVMVSTLRSHFNSSVIVEWCCRTMYGLCVGTGAGVSSAGMSAATQAAENKIKLMTTGVHNHLMFHIIYRYFPNNKYVVAKKLDSDCLPVDVTVERETSYVVIDWALRLVAVLCAKAPDNQELFTALGALDISIDALRLVVGDSVSDIADEPALSSAPQDTASASALLVVGALSVLSQLSHNNQENMMKCFDHEKCATIVQCIVKYTDENTTEANFVSFSAVLQEAFRVVRNLCHENDEMQWIFHGLQVCPAVLQSMEVSRIRTAMAAPAGGASTHGAESVTSKSIATLYAFAGVVNASVQDRRDILCAGEGVAQWGWYTMSSLAMYTPNLHVLNAAATSQCGVDVVVELSHTLNRFQYSEEVCTWCLLAASVLSNDTVSLTSFVLSARPQHPKEYIDFGQAVVCAMSCHISAPCETIIMDGCQVLGRMALLALDGCDSVEECTNEENSHLSILVKSLRSSDLHSIATNGVVNVLVKSLTVFGKHEEVVEQIMFAIFALAHDNAACLEAFLSSTALIKLLPKVFSLHSNVDIICMWACSATLALCKTDNSISILGQHDYCSVLSSCLETHASLIDKVSAKERNYKSLLQIVRTVLSLSSITANCTRFVAGATPKVTTQLLLKHGPVCPELADVCYQVISHHTNCVEGQAVYAGCSACEIGIDVLRFYKCDNPAVVIAGCLALERLSRGYPENVSILNEHSACELTVDILNGHEERKDVATSACNLMGVMATSAAPRVKLGNIGACEAVLSCYRRHEAGDNLTVAILVVMGSLCEDNPVNKRRFGDDYACAWISSILQRFVDNAMVCQWACRAMSSLSEGQRVYGAEFASNGGCEALTECFVRHIESVGVCEQACLAVSALVQDNPANAAIVVSNGAATSLLTATLKINSSSALVISSCRAIINLSAYCNEQLSAAGICEALISAFSTHVKVDMAVAYWCCHAICSLASLEKNHRLLGAYGACEEVTSALSIHVGQESIFSKVMMSPLCNRDNCINITIWGCSAICILANNSEEHTVRLVAAGACECVVRALNRYVDKDEVAVVGCKAIVMLIKGNPAAHALRLGNAGACNSVVEALIAHPGNEQVAGWGCRAVKHLTTNKDSNMAKLTSAGACETVPVAIQAHQTNAVVASAGSGAVAAMASNLDNVVRLGQSGACEAIVFSITKHSSNDRLVERACRALGRLALSSGNASWLGPAGACDAILNALRKHDENEYVVAAAFGAIGNLCNEEHNRLRLQKGGACQSVVHGMVRHPTVQDVTRMCARAIAKLSATPANRAIMFKAGECAALTSALSYHSHSATVSLQICRTIAIIHSENDAEIQSEFGKLGCCDKLLHVMKVNEKTDAVVVAGFVAIASLCTNHPANQERFRMGHIAKLIIEYIDLFIATDVFCEVCCKAIVVMMEDNAENVKYFYTAGLASAMLRILNRHGNKNLQVALHASKVLSSLLQLSAPLTSIGSNNCNTCSKLIQMGSAETLLGLLSKYGTLVGNDLMVVSIGECILHLLNDKNSLKRFGGAGAGRIIPSILRTYEKNKDISVIFCRIVSALCDYGDNNENQKLLGVSGSCKIVAAMYETHALRMMNNRFSSAMVAKRDSGSSTANRNSRSNLMRTSLMGSNTVDTKSIKQQGPSTSTTGSHGERSDERSGQHALSSVDTDASISLSSATREGDGDSTSKLNSSSSDDDAAFKPVGAYEAVIVNSSVRNNHKKSNFCELDKSAGMSVSIPSARQQSDMVESGDPKVMTPILFYSCQALLSLIRSLDFAPKSTLHSNYNRENQSKIQATEVLSVLERTLIQIVPTVLSLPLRKSQMNEFQVLVITTMDAITGHTSKRWAVET